ncbi:MAG: hypothetical protein JHC90_07880, partial [Ilumatobacteraceae bacterium]|nr:hypothetical protein [Ilumatobacteraceae bacterium]
QSAGALSRIIGPAIAGLLFDHAGIAWPYVVAAVLTGAALATVSRRK